MLAHAFLRFEQRRRRDKSPLVSPTLGKRHKTQLIDNQELISGQLFLCPQEPLAITGFQQLVDESRGRREAHPIAFLTSRQTQRQGHMGLPVPELPNALELPNVLMARRTFARRCWQARSNC